MAIVLHSTRELCVNADISYLNANYERYEVYIGTCLRLSSGLAKNEKDL